MKLKIIRLGFQAKKRTYCIIPLYKIPENAKLIYSDSGFLGIWRREGGITEGHKKIPGVMKMFVILIVVMVSWDVLMFQN